MLSKKEENRRKIEEDMRNMKEQKKINDDLRKYNMIESLLIRRHKQTTLRVSITSQKKREEQ